MQKAFERLYSLPHSVIGRKGTGLGLAFVREAAHLHHGSARLSNHPDGGAIAEIRLPHPE
ncbi:MAG: ATP-binding protein [Verrucomicrobiales bacterium]